MSEVRRHLRHIYYGADTFGIRARLALILFDLISVSFFVATTFMDPEPWIIVVDVIIGVVLLLDLVARTYIDHDRLGFLLHPITIADMVVIVSLFAPALLGNFLFLRVIRTLRLLRSYHVMRDLRHRWRWVEANEAVVFAAVNLFLFVFLVSALVYSFQVRVNPSITNYIDALYFTVTTLTTTGFGDVILVGSGGRMLAVVIMVVGVGLFLRLLQSLFRPSKVEFECSECGLSRHDADAVHCKHCGHLIHILTEGR